MIGQIHLRFWILLSVAFAILAPRASQAQDEKTDDGPGLGYVLVPRSAKKIKANLTIEMKAPNLLADEWSVFVCQIPELPGQFEAKTTLLPRGKIVRELSEEGRPMVLTVVPSGDQWRRGIKARAEYETTLIERRLQRREPDEPAPPPVPALDARTRKLFLSSGHQFDFNAPKFKSWLEENKLRRQPAESEIDFARKAFLVVRQGFTHYEGEDAQHLASKVTEAGKSDFMGITAAYVAALRANGIPTRILAGRRVLRNGEPVKNPWTHARTEFFTTGLGWVPADPAGAIRWGGETQGLEFFGNDPADFLTQHIDTDIVLDTYIGVRTHEWMMDPSLWMSGGGSFEGNTIKVNVTVGEVEELNLTDVITRQNTRPASKKSASKTSKKGG